MGLIRFIFSKSFLINVGIAIILSIIAILYVQFRMNKFTLHNEEIGVPDFRGYQVGNINDILQRKNLQMMVIDSLYDRSLDPGAIIQQDPEPGEMVKENRRVYFTINSHNAPLIKLPPLIDQSKRQALATLEILEIDVDTISYKISPYDGLVLDVLYKGVSVAEGSDLPLGSKVRVIVGESANLPKVMMPDLTGLRLSQVDSALKAYSLNRGMIIDCVGCESNLDTNTAVITRTYPQYKANKRVKMGSNVDLWLSSANDTIR